MSSEYIKAQQTYAKLAEAARNGNRQAMADKAKAMNEIRAIERAAAREGVVLSATVRKSAKDDFEVEVGKTETHTKRSLQEEYVRKFEKAAGPGEPEPVVKLNVKGKTVETTLSEHHRNRLLRNNGK